MYEHCGAFIELDTCLAPAAFALRLLGWDTPVFLMARSPNEEKVHATQFPEARGLGQQLAREELKRLKFDASKQESFVMWVLQLDSSAPDTIAKVKDLLDEYDKDTGTLTRIIMFSSPVDPETALAWKMSSGAEPFEVDEHALSPFWQGSWCWLKGYP